MRRRDLPFRSGEIVAGCVVGLRPNFAVVRVCGQLLPIISRNLDWNAIRQPSEILSIGDRLEAVVFIEGDKIYHNWRSSSPPLAWNGVWLTRLPLLVNPWILVREMYAEGSVVEVEMIDYVNWYIARVRFPEGFVVEMKTNEIHPASARHTGLGRPLRPGERFQVVFCHNCEWVRRFRGGSNEDCLAEAGYLSSGIAAKRLAEVERRFIERRNR